MKTLNEFLTNNIDDIIVDEYNFAFARKDHNPGDHWFFMSNRNIKLFKNNMTGINYGSGVDLYDIASWNVLNKPDAWIGICYNVKYKTWFVQDFFSGVEEVNEFLSGCISNTIKYFRNVTWNDWCKYIKLK